MIKKIKNKLFNDKNLLELLQGSSISFVFKITGMGFGYLFTLVIARYYGAETMGLYSLSLTILSIFVTIGVFGFDNALVKFVADYNSKNKLYLVKEVYIKALNISLSLGLLLSLILFLNADFIAINIFNKMELISFFQIISFAILPFILLRINSTIFRGLKNIKLYSFFDGLGISLFSFLGLLLLSQFFTNIDNTIVVIIQTVSIYVLSIISYIYLQKNILVLSSKYTDILKYKDILKVSFPMLLTSSMALIMGWTDTLMLGMFRSEEIVGIYSVVIKLASITSISLMAINSISAPKFAEFYSNGDIEGLKKVAQQSTKMIFYTSLPIIFILTIFSNYILEIFGSEFIIGESALLILMIGQLINAMTGSVGYILIMTGKEKLFQNIIISTSILNIILNYILVQIYGLNGVAISTAISLALLNIIPYFYVKYYYGFYTLSFKIGEK